MRWIGQQAWFAYLTLAALQIKVVWNGWNAWDLSLADGGFYFHQAQQLLQFGRWPPVDASPLFISYYAVFQVFFQEAIHAYTAHRIGMLLLTWLLAYTVFRQVFPAFLAWLLAAYGILVTQNLHNDFVVHAFAVVPVWLALWTATARNVNQNGWGSFAILGTCVLAGLARPELVLSVPLVLIGLGAYDFFVTRRARSPIYITAFVVTFVLSGLVIPTLAGERQMLAFGQHYAWGYGERNDDWNKNHWIAYEEVLQQDFGEADSVRVALQQNPSAFTDHVTHNLRLFPGGVRAILQPTLPWNDLYPVVAGIIGVLCVWVFFRRAADAQNLWRPYGKMWLTALLLPLPLLASMLVVRPRLIYALPFQPVLMLLAGALIYYVVGPRRLERAGTILPVLAGVFLVIYPSPYNIDVGQDISDAVQIIDSIENLPEGFGLMGESGESFCAYIRFKNDCQPYSPERLPAYEAVYPENFIDEQQIHVIVINEGFLERLSPENRGFYETLRDDPRRFGWDVYRDSGLLRVLTPSTLIPQ